MRERRARKEGWGVDLGDMRSAACVVRVVVAAMCVPNILPAHSALAYSLCASYNNALLHSFSEKQQNRTERERERERKRDRESELRRMRIRTLEYLIP